MTQHSTAVSPRVGDFADIMAQYDAQPEVAEQIKSVQQGADEIRASYVEVLKAYVAGIKGQAEAAISDEGSSPAQISAAKNVLMNVDLINNSEKILDFVDITGVKRLNSLRLLDHHKMRSIYRRNRIGGLNYMTVVEAIDGTENPEFREKLICMLNAVLLFSKHRQEAFGDLKNYAVFIKFIFMMMRSNPKMGLIPVLAAASYERFKQV